MSVLVLASVISLLVPSPSIRTALPTLLARHEISLSNRQKEAAVNEIFRKNILLTMSYIRGIEVRDSGGVEWEGITRPFTYRFLLRSEEVFAFHGEVWPRYKKAVVKSAKVNFGPGDGFLSDGHLSGDGVCHLASLINWVAKEAGLKTEAAVNHDFAPINGVPKEFGVSVFVDPINPSVSARQNLYVTNNLRSSVVFEFNYKDEVLSFSVREE